MDIQSVQNYTALPKELLQSNQSEKIPTKSGGASIPFDYFIIILVVLIILFLGAIAAYYLTSA